MQLALVYQNQFPPILVGTTTPDLVKIVISGTISLNFNYDKFWIRKRVLSQFSKKMKWSTWMKSIKRKCTSIHIL